MENLNPSQKKVSYFFAGVLVFIVLLKIALGAPFNFPTGERLRVEEGDTLREVSKRLKEKNIINSRIIFEAFVIMYGGEKRILSGDYLFSAPEPVYQVARRISKGESRLPPVKVTIPEGYTALEIGDTFASKLESFNRERFLQVARPKEGYLFPDTYFFFSNATEEDAFKSLRDNYEKKMAPIRPKILNLGKTEKEIIIMASIIEKEAKGEADREIISGILWKRLSAGMPLQVDAAPYTYKERGLTPGPIANPGLKAINAAMYPKATDYLFYLHDKNGVIHYARNFEEHKENKKLYLE